ncbi:NAD(P)H-binding protein [Fructilactobacillus florum]|uniref:Saccharopine dehydrogenase related protein n=1 Tax=Fructilactobacillus florum DSM 22689 = JCM 16035 TaxID=1423745 RepID=A0A0R2CWD7_9LACO|nr:NAD(P)H-binding protein [Fructilactobacillus florum]KRM91875.1 saccharopine dehydrogenase related protein [Fructilactobacillus florum DSM 22689 = JCM 16035]
MTNTLILGANGSIAQMVEADLLAKPDQHLTLYLRDSKRLENLSDNSQVTLVEGDVLDEAKLQVAMKGQDIVFVAMGATSTPKLIENVITAMKAENVKRVISINDLGIYGEVPGKFGKWNQSMVGSGLSVGKESDELLEKSGLDYTTLRLAWLGNGDDSDFETTQKGQPFKGTTVNRKGVAKLVTGIILDPKLYDKESIGVNRPGTEGDQPVF